MIYVNAILAVLKLFGFVLDWMKTNQMMTAGGDKIIADALRGQADDLHKADLAREEVRADLTAHPERLREHDEFERPTLTAPGPKAIKAGDVL